MYKEHELRKIFANKRIMIAGFGREGQSSYKLIKKLFAQPNDNAAPTLAIADKNTSITHNALISNDDTTIILTGEDYLASSNEYDIILKSPGIPTFDFESIASAEKISSQADIFLQVYHSQTIGITGTKGKSTTTNLIYSMMRTSYPETIMAGNMGLPLFDCIENITDKSIMVLELSSHQLENIHRSPHVGIVLNLFQEHLDHYHSYKDYQLAKLKIGSCQSEKDIFIYCYDNADLRQLVEETDIKSIVLEYSLEKSVGIGCYLADGTVRIMPSGDSIYNANAPRHLQGKHNLGNCMAAFLVGHCYGIADEKITNAIAQFKGLEHRMEFVDTVNGISFYNDSISTIPEAAVAAIDALKNVDTIILGGYDRGIDYSLLANFIEKSDISNIAFTGMAGERIHNLLANNNVLSGRNYFISNSYPDIVEWCFRHTQKGKTCLLSPAASSYDAFKNFEERGRLFKDLVRARKEK